MARIGALLAGLPETVGGLTINRYCSSGINAVQIAADRIRTGEADVVIAAGSGIHVHGADDGQQGVAEPGHFAKDENYAIAYGMGLTAEKVAQQWKVSREDQDAFAVESHRRAIAAIQSGAFANEITRWTPPTARPTWPPAK